MFHHLDCLLSHFCPSPGRFQWVRCVWDMQSDMHKHWWQLRLQLCGGLPAAARQPLLQSQKWWGWEKKNEQSPVIMLHDSGPPPPSFLNIFSPPLKSVHLTQSQWIVCLFSWSPTSMTSDAPPWVAPRPGFLPSPPSRPWLWTSTMLTRLCAGSMWEIPLLPRS